MRSGVACEPRLTALDAHLNKPAKWCATGPAIPADLL